MTVRGWGVGGVLVVAVVAAVTGWLGWRKAPQAPVSPPAQIQQTTPFGREAETQGRVWPHQQAASAEVKPQQPPSVRPGSRTDLARLSNRELLYATAQQWPPSTWPDVAAFCDAVLAAEPWLQQAGAEALLKERLEALRLQLVALLLSHPDEFARAQGQRLAGMPQDPITLAASATQPLTVVLAWRQCLSGLSGHNSRWTGGLPGCALPVAQRWVQLDPPNAIAWLALAEAQKAQGDEMGFETSLQQAAASAYATQMFAQPMAVIEAIARQAGLGPTWLLGYLLEQLAFEQDPAFPNFKMLLSHCDPQQPQAAERRPVCLRLGMLLVDRGQEILQLMLGLGFMERLGQPVAEAERFRRAYVAFGSAYGDVDWERLDQLPPRRRCEVLSRSLDDMLRAAREGEVRTMLDRARLSRCCASPLPRR